MRAISIIALILMAVGAINWGLVGLFNFNLVEAIFGTSATGVLLQRIVYVLVGIAGLYGILMVTRLASKKDDVCVPGHHEYRAATS